MKRHHKMDDELSFMSALLLTYYLGWVVYLVTAISVYSWKVAHQETHGIEFTSVVLLVVCAIMVIGSAFKDQEGLIARVLVKPESIWWMIFWTLLSFFLSYNVISSVEDYITPYARINESMTKMHADMSLLVNHRALAETETTIAYLTYFLDAALEVNVLTLASWVQVCFFFPLLAGLLVHHHWSQIVSKWDELRDRF